MTAPAPRRALPTVVYIAGEGHSGSTLLELLLGSQPGVVAAGELCMLAPDAPGRDRVFAKPCVCGAATRPTCPFWGEVDARLRDELGAGLLEIRVDDPDDARFAATNRALVAAIADASGAAVVVDSSKRSDRLARLLAIPDLDVVPVALFRDPRGVVWSHVRRERGWLYYAAAYAWGAMRLREVLAGRPAPFIRYERLARHPEATLDRILALLGRARVAGALDWTAHEHHALAGNRMQRERSARIRIDERWRTALPGWVRAAVAAMALPGRLAPTGLPGADALDRWLLARARERSVRMHAAKDAASPWVR